MTTTPIITPPPSGEAPRPFTEVVEAALEALPADTPTNPEQLLVGLDVDGTLITASGASQRVRRAFHTLAQAGGHPVVTTGRSLSASIPVMRQLDAPYGRVVCSNGSLFADFDPIYEAGACVVQARYFGVDEVIDRACQAIPGALIGVESGLGFLLSQAFPQGEFVEEFRVAPMGELRAQQTSKLVIRAPWMDVPEFSEAIAASDLRDTHEVFVGWTSWADVGPLGVTKASALAELADEYDVPPAGTVAIGDGSNDVPMLQWAAFGVAMGAASSQVQAEANHVTAAVENDGAAAVMEALLVHCGVRRLQDVDAS